MINNPAKNINIRAFFLQKIIATTIIVTTDGERVNSMARGSSILPGCGNSHDNGTGYDHVVAHTAAASRISSFCLQCVILTSFTTGSFA